MEVLEAMVSTEKFCLRWNDFEANISSAFRDLKEEKEFSDVTLVCAGQQVEAHKVISKFYFQKKKTAFGGLEEWKPWDPLRSFASDGTTLKPTLADPSTT